MKLNLNVIRILVIGFFLLNVISLQAQGLYSTKTNSQTTTTNNLNNGGGFYRGPGGNDGGPAGGGDSEEDPIGEGIVILSLLSCSYAFIKRNIKRNIKNRYED